MVDNVGRDLVSSSSFQCVVVVVCHNSLQSILITSKHCVSVLDLSHKYNNNVSSIEAGNARKLSITLMCTKTTIRFYIHYSLEVYVHLDIKLNQISV